jgi:flagellar basal-body rod protein FlgG
MNGIRWNAEAMNALMTRQDVIANNMANASTVGFKREVVGFSRFEQTLGAAISAGSKTDVNQGAFHETGNPFDLAVMGAGYFSVETPDGTRYTRDGSFSLDEKGYVVDHAGRKVVGTSGPIRITGDASDVTVQSDGRVMIDGEEKARLKIAHFSSDAVLQRSGDGLVGLASGEEVDGKSNLMQGFLESSNVNTVQEMVSMMDGLRLFESNQRALRLQDNALGQAISDLSR